jgi:hypothetical protein
VAAVVRVVVLTGLMVAAALVWVIKITTVLLPETAILLLRQEVAVLVILFHYVFLKAGVVFTVFLVAREEMVEHI